MFRAVSQDDLIASATGVGTAVSLSHTQVVPTAPTEGEPARQRLRARVGARIHAFEAWCERVELAPDLAMDIGSRRWYRGLATMLGIGAVALSFWPDFSTVEAATTVAPDSGIRDQFRSQTIAPLGMGADSGRHMGATKLVRPLANVPERPEVQVVATLAQGDSFTSMLRRVGVGVSDVDQVARLVSTAVPLNQIAPGTQVNITLGPRPADNQPRTLADMDFRARFDLDLSIARHGDALSLSRHPIAVDTTPLRIRGTIGSSLYISARNAGAPVAAIQSYLQAIDRQVSLESDVNASDTFDMILSYKRSAMGERQVGDLLYAGIERAGKPSVQLMRWGKDGQLVPSPSANAAPTSVALGMPVAGRITSGFGMRRHPILGYVRMHAGIDFGAAYGSPIYAVSDGVVNFAGRHGGHGNYVRLDHGGGMGTGYGHMSRIAVAYGAHVRAGQVIGYVGSSGLSTGPHLHFEAYRNGQVVNPTGLRLTSRPSFDPKERDAYMARLRELLKVQEGKALGTMVAPVREDTQARREIDRLSEPTGT